MAVPLRTTAAIPSRRGTTPFRERDWFKKRSSTALAVKVNQRLEKVKLGLTRLITEGTPEVSGAAGTSAVDPQLSEAGIATPEVGSNADSGSESEPEDSGVRDPLDPEPDFRRHPNACRLWVARAERRRAEREKASGPAAAATASSSAERENGPSAPTKPPMPKAFHQVDGDVERFIRQLADYFSLARVTDDLDKIHTAGMLCEGKAGGCYETYSKSTGRWPCKCSGSGLRTLSSRRGSTSRLPSGTPTVADVSGRRMSTNGTPSDKLHQQKEMVPYRACGARPCLERPISTERHSTKTAPIYWLHAPHSACVRKHTPRTGVGTQR
jgi:hypothetical protein